MSNVENRIWSAISRGVRTEIVGLSNSTWTMRSRWLSSQPIWVIGRLDGEGKAGTKSSGPMTNEATIDRLRKLP